MGTRCDCGALFIIVMTFLHGSDSNCGVTTTHGLTFYKAGLIMGKITLNCF